METTEVSLAQLSTSQQRVRCVRPALQEQMASSLAKHGQLTPLVLSRQEEKLEVIDGFKRVAAAGKIRLATLRASIVALDEVSRWAVMLSLNRGAGRMTELEEAMVLQQLVAQGLTQVQVAQMVCRHKSWVSRRVGLLERLHPELVAGMRDGVLHPGVARRLLALPPGNQLQVATAAQQAGLGPRDTELLVSLWQRAEDHEVRKQLLAHPAEAVRAAHPEHAKPAPDLRLTVSGRQLQRLLHLLATVAPRALLLLPPSDQDRAVLSPLLAQTSRAVSPLASELGRCASGASGGANDESGGRS